MKLLSVLLLVLTSNRSPSSLCK